MSQPVNFECLSITITQANKAQRISQTPIRVQQFELYVKSSTAPVYVGSSTVSTDCIPRAPGSVQTFTASSGGNALKGPWFDLSNVYLLCGTVNAVVTIEYLKIVS